MKFSNNEKKKVVGDGEVVQWTKVQIPAPNSLPSILQGI